MLLLRSPARLVLLASCLALAGALRAQEGPIRVPASTPLAVQLVKRAPMKIGQPLEGRLIYPVYVGNRLAIPAGATLSGSVVALKSDRTQRIQSRLNGDFTPFHIPVVRFDALTPPGGQALSIVSGDATDGAPILRLSTPASGGKRSFLSRQIAQAKQRFKDTLALVTAPGRGDRLKEFLYTQVPYHSQRIQNGTAWTIELSQPLELASIPPEKPAAGDASAAKTEGAPTWRLSAYLDKTVTSATAKAGDTFQAVVAEPVFDPDRTLAVPEGAVLVGTITQAKPARSFGRKGKLRFNFRELKMPDGFSQHVEGSLAAADSNKAAALSIDSEGSIQPQPQNRVIVPMLLAMMGSRGLDTDGSAAANGAVASNGMGIGGRIVGIVAGSRNIAAGLGFYAAGLAFAERWLVRGTNVVFVKNTRIEVTTSPSGNPMSVGAPALNPKPAR